MQLLLLEIGLDCVCASKLKGECVCLSVCLSVCLLETLSLSLPSLFSIRVSTSPLFILFKDVLNFPLRSSHLVSRCAPPVRRFFFFSFLLLPRARVGFAFQSVTCTNTTAPPRRKIKSQNYLARNSQQVDIFFLQNQARHKTRFCFVLSVN